MSEGDTTEAVRPPARTAYPLATRIATAWCGAVWWAATAEYAPSEGVSPVTVLVCVVLGGGALAEHGCTRMVPVVAPCPGGAPAPPQNADAIVADTVGRCPVHPRPPLAQGKTLSGPPSRRARCWRGRGTLPRNDRFNRGTRAIHTAPDPCPRRDG